jgi:hypothetical protein
MEKAAAVRPNLPQTLRASNCLRLAWRRKGLIVFLSYCRYRGISRCAILGSEVGGTYWRHVTDGENPRPFRTIQTAPRTSRYPARLSVQQTDCERATFGEAHDSRQISGPTEPNVARDCMRQCPGNYFTSKPHDPEQWRKPMNRNHVGIALAARSQDPVVEEVLIS